MPRPTFNRTGAKETRAKKQETMTPTEHIEVETDTVSCDGGGGALGHPMVSLKIAPKEGEQAPNVVCPYCSRRFVLKSGGAVAEGH